MPKKVTRSEQILGKVATKSNCVVCSKPIPEARIEALKLLNVPLSRYTHVNCSTTVKVKGIYSGENGTSKIILCDKIYNDSVRSVFKRAEVSEEGAEEDDN